MDFKVDLWQFLMLILGGPIAWSLRQNISLSKEFAKHKETTMAEAVAHREEMNKALASIRERLDEKVRAAEKSFYEALAQLATVTQTNHQKLSTDIHNVELDAKDSFASITYLQDVEVRLQSSINDVKTSVERIEDHLLRK